MFHSSQQPTLIGLTRGSGGPTFEMDSIEAINILSGKRALLENLRLAGAGC